MYIQNDVRKYFHVFLPESWFTQTWKQAIVRIKIGSIFMLQADKSPTLKLKKKDTENHLTVICGSRLT